MQLHDLAAVSNAVSRTRGRLDKIARLAELLQRLPPDEISIAVAYLSGSLPQGRIGIGWSVLSSGRAAAPPAAEPSLSLPEINAVFQRIASIRGAGASGTRARLVIDLFSRATEIEQDFLVRLLSGELRQGAQEGVLAEAVARAANVPAEAVRQAAMMCGDLSEVSRAALVEGAPALATYSIQLFRPVEPMLASPAESVSDAIAAFGRGGIRAEARWRAHSGAQVGRRGTGVFARASGCDGCSSRGSRSRPAVAGSRDHPRWRGALDAARRHAVAVSRNDAAFWATTGYRSSAVRTAA